MSFKMIKRQRSTDSSNESSTDSINESLNDSPTDSYIESSINSLNQTIDELSDESSNEDSVAYVETPNYSFLNKNSELLKIRQNPDEPLKIECHTIFSYPNFEIETNKLSNNINLTIIEEVRQKFKDVMQAIQFEEDTILMNGDDFRERAYSLDISHVDECIRNGTL